MNGFVKLCGLTREPDVRTAVETGADALGFVFWPRSPRCIPPGFVRACAIPSTSLKVGIFVDQPPETVRDLFDAASLDIAQLHGAEDAEYLRRLDRPAWKAVHLDRLPPNLDTLPVQAVLIDSGTVAMPGGTGVRVDTGRARRFIQTSPHKVLLAGGLKADTVADAIRAVTPFGVDVSSGTETAPGIKDPARLSAFVREARLAFQSLSPPKEHTS